MENLERAPQEMAVPQARGLHTLATGEGHIFGRANYAEIAGARSSFANKLDEASTGDISTSTGNTPNAKPDMWT